MLIPCKCCGKLPIVLKKATSFSTFRQVDGEWREMSNEPGASVYHAECLNCNVRTDDLNSLEAVEDHWNYQYGTPVQRTSIEEFLKSMLEHTESTLCIISREAGNGGALIWYKGVPSELLRVVPTELLETTSYERTQSQGVYTFEVSKTDDLRPTHDHWGVPIMRDGKD